MNWVDGITVNCRKSRFQRKNELSWGHIKLEVPLKFLSENDKELGGYTGQEHRKSSGLEKLIWDLSKEIG